LFFNRGLKQTIHTNAKCGQNVKIEWYTRLPLSYKETLLRRT